MRNYKLTDSQHGFNTKIIVADASIVEQDVIKQHFSDTAAEPNKIFFRKAVGNKQPLSVEQFEFNRLGATIINANSYPARNLDINYKLFLDCFNFDSKASLAQTNTLIDSVQKQIIDDITERLSRSNTAQVIVYIQDKSRLQRLIDKIKNSWVSFDKNTDYLEIHADISEQEKEDIHNYKNRVKVVFMTSSASRGLSFPMAKHILVDIPRFEIEKNLMEVIQVIYRGRGEYENGKTLDGEDKELVFYLADRAVYYSDDRELSLQESVLSLINILLILKTSVMTRINGAGQLGRENFLMIPIGGKSVSAAGGKFTGEMSTLIQKLKKEHRRNPSNRVLKKIYTSLEQLLSRADIVVRNIAESQAVSYLSLRQDFTRQFSQSVNNGFDKLLEWVIEPGYVNGSLLLVPLANKTVEEKYEMQLEQQIRTYATDELLRNMLAISHSRESPESLKSAIKDAIKLIDLLREPVNKTQGLEQNTQRFDQYYALPLLAFISGEVMSEYFGNEPQEPEDQQFRDILATYIRTLYPVNNILPISHQYKDFPFVVFSSYSLGELREKLFTDKYLLNSNELNVLNLILSKAT